MKSFICIAWLLLFSTTAHAQVRFRIEDKTDALTRETLLVAGDLMVCPVKEQRIGGCGTLQFRWNPATPETIAMRIELTGQQVSIQEIKLRVNDEVRGFTSATPTDIDYSSGLPGQLGWSSANVFVLPVTALDSLTKDDPSLMRVCDVHDCVDFDFRRRAKFRGIPLDELVQLVAAIAERVKP